MFMFLSVNLCLANQPTQINNGRYVIYMHPQYRGDQYLLDTQTGKTWHLVKTDSDELVWEAMFFDCYNIDKKYLGRFINPR